MAKTYTALTVANATAGNAILASDFSSLFTNSNNYRVPPSCRVVRTSDQTGYTGTGNAITWQSAAYDTDSPMWAAGAPTLVTINTTGLYVVEFYGSYTATATVTEYEALVSQAGSVAGSALRAFYKTGNTTSGRFTISGIVNCAANDTLTAGISFVGGSAYVVKGNATTPNADQTRLSVTWVGQVS